MGGCGFDRFGGGFGFGGFGGFGCGFGDCDRDDRCGRRRGCFDRFRCRRDFDCDCD